MAELRHMESEIVGRRVQKRMQGGATLFDALAVAAKEAAQRQKRQERVRTDGEENRPATGAD